MKTPSRFESVRAVVVELLNPKGMRLNALGIQCAKAGNVNDAEGFFREAILVAPKLPLPKINLANILHGQFRFEEAEKILTEALNSPHYAESKADVLYALGNSYFGQRRVKEALQQYESIRETVATTRAEVEYQIGACCEHLGEWKTALQAYKRARHSGFSREVALTPATIEHAVERIGTLEKQPHFTYTPELPAPKPFTRERMKNLGIAERLLQKIKFDKTVTFLVGGGVSRPEPTNLPLAKEIVWSVFCMLFELDRDDICRVFKPRDRSSIYTTICSELVTGSAFLPFEPSFKALRETVGYSALRFVDTLNIEERGQDGKKRQKFNMHHYMLAHAIRKGHLVITVNFDRCIEEAYETLFKPDKPKVLIRERDFWEDIDNGGVLEGKLMKLHGSMEDYSSIALTLDQIMKDSSGRGFTHAMGIPHLMRDHSGEVVFTESMLSEPKALFLKKALQDSCLIVLGYSNSDDFDIRPILESEDVKWRGLWVDHSEKADTEDLTERVWGQLRLSVDTGKVTRHLMDQLGVKLPEPSTDTDWPWNWDTRFREWSERLRFVKGDGLHWLGKLYSQRGLWKRAADLYKLAALRYENTLTEKWAATIINLDFVRCKCGLAPEAGGNGAGAMETLRDICEKGQLPASVRNLYAHSLLNRAGSHIIDNNPGVWRQTASLIDQALDVAGEVIDPDNLAFAYELRGDLLFAERKCPASLNYYREAYRIAKESTGDFVSLMSTMIAMARCLAHLNQEDVALGLLEQAGQIAKNVGSQHWTNRIAVAFQRDLKWQSVLHLEIQEQVARELSSHAGYLFRGDMDELNALFFRWLPSAETDPLQSEELFPRIKGLLKDLLEKYGSTPAVNYLRIVESSLTVFHLKMQQIVTRQQGMPESSKAALQRISKYVRCMSYGEALRELNELLKVTDAPQTKSHLFFLKSNIHRRQNARKEEIETLQEYCKIVEDDPLAEHNLGVAFLALEDYPNAATHLLRAIALLDGCYPLAAYNLCLVYLKSGDIAKARSQRDNLIAMGIPDSWLDDLKRRIE